MKIENISFYNNINQRLAGRIYSPPGTCHSGVIFSHGLFSNKDGYKITRLASDIVSTDHVLMTYDFSFSGGSEGDISDLSLLQEAEDLKSAVEFFKDRGMKSIHLMGSSMGATVTILYASQHGETISSLMLVAALVDIKNFIYSNTTLADIDSLPENGMTHVGNSSLKNSFFKEIAKINMLYNLNTLTMPVLAIHGGCDSAVDLQNVIVLERNVKTFFKKVIISDGDHNLTRDHDLYIIKNTIKAWLSGDYKNIPMKLTEADLKCR